MQFKENIFKFEVECKGR